MWDAENGKELLTLRGHSSFVYAVAFSPDSKLLATAGEDKTAKVWDAESGKELLTLRGHSSAVNGVAFSPDGKRLATASADGTVQVYALDRRELLDLARSRLTRTFTAEECLRYFQSRPARPYLKFRMLHDQTYSFVPLPSRPANKCSKSLDCLVVSRLRYERIDSRIGRVSWQSSRGGKVLCSHSKDRRGNRSSVVAKDLRKDAAD